MSRLITPSLLGSIKWLRECPPSWREKARIELRAALARDYSGPKSPALELGSKFEDMVYRCAAAQASGKGSDLFQDFVKECVGGVFQRKTRRIIEVDGYEYCLYGKLDVWFPTVIKDIKTTSNYKGRDYYLESFQHKMYCYNERIDDFVYLVAEFDDRQKLVDKHMIDYHVEDREALREEVFNEVREAVAFLSTDSEWFELYTTKFSRY